PPPGIGQRLFLAARHLLPLLLHTTPSRLRPGRPGSDVSAPRRSPRRDRIGLPQIARQQPLAFRRGLLTLADRRLSPIGTSARPRRALQRVQGETTAHQGPLIYGVSSTLETRLFPTVARIPVDRSRAIVAILFRRRC